MRVLKDLLKDLNNELTVKKKDADTEKIKRLLLTLGEELEKEDCTVPWDVLEAMDQDMRKLTLTSFIVTVTQML